MSDVINDVMGVVIGLGPVVAALLWCNLNDRLRHRANRVGAEIRATANRVLGGRIHAGGSRAAGDGVASRPRASLDARRLRVPDRERLRRGHQSAPPRLRAGRPPRLSAAGDRAGESRWRSEC